MTDEPLFRRIPRSSLARCAATSTRRTSTMTRPCGTLSSVVGSPNRAGTSRSRRRSPVRAATLVKVSVSSSVSPGRWSAARASSSWTKRVSYVGPDSAHILSDQVTRVMVSAASLDNESDKLVQKVIREEFSDCTNLTVAHRLGESERRLCPRRDALADSAPKLFLCPLKTPSSTLIASWSCAPVASPSLTSPQYSWIAKTAHSGTWSKRPVALMSCTSAHRQRPEPRHHRSARILGDRNRTGVLRGRQFFFSSFFPYFPLVQCPFALHTRVMCTVFISTCAPDALPLIGDSCGPRDPFKSARSGGRATVPSWPAPVAEARRRRQGLDALVLRRVARSVPVAASAANLGSQVRLSTCSAARLAAVAHGRFDVGVGGQASTEAEDPPDPSIAAPWGRERPTEKEQQQQVVGVPYDPVGTAAAQGTAAGTVAEAGWPASGPSAVR